ncbi:MAG: PAS domain S-box protein, partial [Chloroflexi bacterium]|nr:PAS domain S-box protein [Chloroflexota bacterium]
MSKRKPETKIKGTDISVELATVLDAFPFYVMLIDEDHRIIFANKSVSNDLGVEPQSVIGGYCPRVVHGLDEPFPGCPLEEAVGRGHAAVTRQLYDARFGRWVESEVYPLGRRTAEGCEIYLHMTRDITIEKKAEEEARRGYDVQEVLNSILRLSLEDTSIDELLRRVLDLLLSIPWLSVESRGAIFLAEDDSGVLLMKAQRGLSKSLQESCARLPFGKCLCGRAALTQETQFADCLDDRHEVTYAGIAEHGHYCVPVLFAGKTLGVINLYIRQAH